MRKLAINTLFIIGAIAIAYFIGSSLLYAYVFKEFSPVQPINFSHKVHAKGGGIPCLYCHVYATKSVVAGVPSVEKCIGCHRSIKKDSPEIQKIYKAWNHKKPIKWVKVYDLPDYIYFPHKRHVKAKVKCQECHGTVENMDRVYKYSSLGMGWCLDCHKKRNGPIDCWECHI